MNMSLEEDRKLSAIEVIEDHVSTDSTTAAEEKALVRKIDMYLMPTIWIMYLLSYMDRTNIGMPLNFIARSCLLILLRQCQNCRHDR
jgi:hypothetical protein